MIRHPIAAGLLAVAFSACHAQTMTNLHPPIERNAHPHEGYQIKITLGPDAPALASVQSYADYALADKNCADVGDDITHKNDPRETLDLPLTKQADGSYVTTVYRDALVDKDYYGKGVCDWVLQSQTIAFKATGKHEETAFLIGFTGNELHSGLENTFWFGKKLYPRHQKVENFSEFGETDRSKIVLTDDQLFHATVEVTEVH